MKEALLYTTDANERAHCAVCIHRCAIAPGHCGMCGTRENRAGRLYTHIYDQVSAVQLDPIEKKPLYHFFPGSQVLSLGTYGCSFRCPGCQNWELSRRAPDESDATPRRITPQQAVQMAVTTGAAGICWTYNDPAIWIEHTLEAARLAREHGLYTAYVTNGTATREHLDLIGPYLDAYRVDIKACTPEAYRAISGVGDGTEIFAGVEYAKTRWGLHVECVTNVTPTINDSDEELRGIAHWIVTHLGPDTPWHLTRFHPYEGFAHLPATPLATLDRVYLLGQEAGLRFLYVGNVSGDPRQHTHCPHCAAVVVRRQGFTVTAMDIAEGKCPHCAAVIAGRFV